jgi:serine/threonine-protein kinase
VPAETISHYRIIRKLGSGGMGDVYLAEDTNLHRPVALKLLPEELGADPQRKARFLREAHAASILSHPHICVIHEAGETADGVLFIAMEYVEGTTLASRIDGQPMPPAEIAAYGAQIADAIDEAHSKGIVHRDLKPANIMITSRGHVKVLDFGLAKVREEVETVGGDDVSTGIRSTPGLLLGTLPYMSPEQALGHPVDHRTDIFSLGIILYEMATGRLPFAGTTPSERITNIARAEPAPLDRSVSPDLALLIRKCLEKEPQRRFQSAHEINFSSTARRPRDFRTISAIVAFLIALIAAGVFVFRNRSRNEIEALAVLPFANATRNPDLEYLSDGIADSLINNLSRLPQLRVMARSTTFRLRGQVTDPQKIGRDLHVDALLTGEVRPHGNTLDVSAELVRTEDGSQIWGEHYDTPMTEAVSLQSRITSDVSRVIRGRMGAQQQQTSKRGTDDSTAYELYLKGRYAWNKQTPESLQAAEHLFQQAIERDPHYALAYVGLADTYLMGVTFSDAPAAESLPKARAAASRALEIDDSLAEAYASLAMTQFNYWQWAGAEKNFRRSIELNPNYATAHDWYSTYLVTRGRMADALEQIKRAQQLDPLSSIIAADVGAVEAMNGDPATAIAGLEQVVKVDPDLPIAHQWLGFAYYIAGRTNDYVAESRKALLPQQPTMLAYANLAFALGRAGRKSEAAAVAKNVLENRNKPGIQLMCVAGAYMAIGDHDHAIEWLSRGVDQRMGTMTYITWPPWFDDIKHDPRYEALLHRMNLR